MRVQRFVAVPCACVPAPLPLRPLPVPAVLPTPTPTPTPPHLLNLMSDSCSSRSFRFKPSSRFLKCSSCGALQRVRATLAG
jgi:hypothetical protein